MSSPTLPIDPARRDPILVVGAAVLDRIFYVDTLPAPGETSIGSRMELYPGGKGANQALAAARMGADVTLISAVGDDEPGRTVLAPLQAGGVNIDPVLRVPEHPTAEAVIAVDKQGQNQITACPGAYHTLSPDHLEERRPLFERARFLLIQFELPAPTVTHAIALGKEYGLTIIFNPDPYTRRSKRPPKGLDVLIPNEQQAAAILGVDDYEALDGGDRAQRWREVEAGRVVVTLGGNGVEWTDDRFDRMFHQPALADVEVVDTVGAGDQFCGALTAFLAEGLPFDDAVQLANRAAGLSVSHHGAQTGQRTRTQLRKIV